MPGIARSWASVIRATASPVVAIVSAAERYARILNAFSPLISRRSAISPNTCATEALSTGEPVALERVVDQPGAALGQRLLYAGHRLGRPEAEETPATAGAAHLGGRRTGRAGPRDEIVDEGRRDAGRQPLAVLPLVGDGAAGRVPVAPDERRPHGGRRVANPLEAVEDVRVAVDVLLGDLPVVGAREVRLA